MLWPLCGAPPELLELSISTWLERWQLDHLFLVLAETRRRASTWRSFVIHPHSNVKLHMTAFYSKRASVVNNQILSRFPELVRVYHDKGARIGIFSVLFKILLIFKGLRMDFFGFFRYQH